MGLIELSQIAKLRPIEDLISKFSAFSTGGTTQPSANSPAVQGIRGGVRASRQVPEPIPDTPPPAGQQGKTEPAQSPPAPAPEIEIPPPVRDSRELLLRIAASVGREALESCLQNLAGARVQGERVILEPGKAGEFVRRQVKENLPDITRAASRVLGSTVVVVLGDPPVQSISQERASGNPSPGDDLLEKAKKEPVIRSFLDIFPGPVKAEKLDS
jgi:hypothetical protein